MVTDEVCSSPGIRGGNLRTCDLIELGNAIYMIKRIQFLPLEDDWIKLIETIIEEVIHKEISLPGVEYYVFVDDTKSVDTIVFASSLKSGTCLFQNFAEHGSWEMFLLIKNLLFFYLLWFYERYSIDLKPI